MYIHTDSNINKKKILDLDIPVISEDNAILYLKRNDDYTQHFKLPEIGKGLVLYKHTYYYFDHNILNTPIGYTTNPYSYDVYPITTDLAEKLIKEKKSLKWEIYFNCYANFQTSYLMVRNNGYITNYKYDGRIEGDKLILPKSISPANITEGISIEKYIETHNKQYPYAKEKLELNRRIIRDNLINDVLN